MSSKKPKIVKVTWGDAWYDSEYVDPDSAHLNRMMRVEDVGYIVARTAHGITLSPSYTSDFGGLSAFRGAKFIPTGMILKIEVLNAGKSGNRD